MIKLNPKKFQELIILVQSQKVTFGIVKGNLLQGVVNLLKASKGLNIKVTSSKEGLIFYDASVESDKIITLNIVDFITEMPEYSDSMVHSVNNPSAELRFFPVFNSMLLVKGTEDNNYILNDDEGNSFNCSNEVRSLSAKVTQLAEFFPKLIQARKESTDIIEKALKASGVDALKVGDTVSLKTFEAMEEEFGSTVYPVGDGKSIKLTAIINGATNIPFLSTAQYLNSRVFTVHQLKEDSLEVILRDADGETSFTKLINPETGEEITIPSSIRFSRLHITKQ